MNRFLLACTAAALVPAAMAQKIYTCVDAKGRHLTSDRPIVECNDREQRELSSSGQLVGKVGPSMSANERIAEEEKARKAAEERAQERDRQAAEKKRARALLARYPNPAAHDKERAAQLAPVDTLITTADRHLADLSAQRKRLQVEAAKDPAKSKRPIEDLDRQMETQKQIIATQQSEKQRINARFDTERVRLQELWGQ